MLTECPNCGCTDLQRAIKNISYEESGVNGIILADMIISRCPHCFDFYNSIPSVSELHLLIEKLLFDDNRPYPAVFAYTDGSWKAEQYSKKRGVN